MIERANPNTLADAADAAKARGDYHLAYKLFSDAAGACIGHGKAGRLQACADECFALTNRGKFQDAYLAALTAAVKANPRDYAYGLKKVPDMAYKMVDALASKSANLSPTVKEVAKKLGVKPTLTEIAEYLSK